MERSKRSEKEKKRIGRSRISSLFGTDSTPSTGQTSSYKSESESESNHDQNHHQSHQNHHQHDNPPLGPVGRRPSDDDDDDNRND